MPEFQVDSHEMQELWDGNPASTIQLTDAHEREENMGDLSVKKYRTNNDGGAKQLMSPIRNTMLPRELSTFHSGSRRKRSHTKEKMSESKSRLSHGRKLFMTRLERDAIGSIGR
jgi:hypothetical protein